MLCRMKHLVIHEQCPATHFLVHTHLYLAPGLPFDLPKRVTPRIYKTAFQMRITQKESKTQGLVSQLKLSSSSDRFSICRVPVWSYISLIKVSCSVKSLRCNLGDLRSHSWKSLQHCRTWQGRRGPGASETTLPLSLWLKCYMTVQRSPYFSELLYSIFKIKTNPIFSFISTRRL